MRLLASCAAPLVAGTRLAPTRCPIPWRHHNQTWRGLLVPVLPPVRSHSSIAALKTALDERIVGHSDSKLAILLALISREHVYIEGPPGQAKTAIAEFTASLIKDLERFTYQFHRDTRVSELVGEAIIRREQSSDGGEILRHDVLPGGVATAHLCVLDDITRAPSEALNILLRLLNERQFQGKTIPLMTCIATSNPTDGHLHVNEPLDAATLDRFTLQVSSKSLITSGEWASAARVLDLCADAPKLLQKPSEDSSSALSLASLVAVQLAADKVAVPLRVRQALLAILGSLVEQLQLDDTNSLITDRTFLVKAISVLRAKATLDNRSSVAMDDLHVLSLLTTFRVPAESQGRVATIIADAIAEYEDDLDSSGTGGETGAGGGPSSGEPVGDSSDTEDGALAEGEEKVLELSSGNMHDIKDNRLGELTSSSDASTTEQNEDAGPATTAATAQRRDAEGLRAQDGQRSPTVAIAKPAEPTPVLRCGASVDVLLSVVEGQMEKERSGELLPSQGGSCRSYKRVSELALSDLEDVDAMEMFAFCMDPSPGTLPRQAVRTERGNGLLCMVRDTSRSMTGWNTMFASSLASAVARLARRRQLRLGYLEFSDTCSPCGHLGAAKPMPFFSKRYQDIERLAQDASCSGSTNYQVPLEFAAREFRKERGAGKTGRHIIFITDGVPTEGDPHVQRELGTLSSQGVAIHSVFIGQPQSFPTTLQHMSSQTGGGEFVVHIGVGMGATGFATVMQR